VSIGVPLVPEESEACAPASPCPPEHRNLQARVQEVEQAHTAALYEWEQDMEDAEAETAELHAMVTRLRQRHAARGAIIQRLRKELLTARRALAAKETP
jgi:hypothetical protein